MIMTAELFPRETSGRFRKTVQSAHARVHCRDCSSWLEELCLDDVEWEYTYLEHSVAEVNQISPVLSHLGHSRGVTALKLQNLITHYLHKIQSKRHRNYIMEIIL